MVDGFLWELDDYGKYQAILLLDEVVHEPRGVCYLAGKQLAESESVH